MELHHKCETKRCINPDHTTAVTHVKNMQLARKYDHLIEILKSDSAHLSQRALSKTHVARLLRA